MMRPRYIEPTGLLRNQRLRFYDFSMRRISFIALTLSILFLTNPANSSLLSRIPSWNGLWHDFKKDSSKNRNSYRTKGGSRRERDFVGSIVWDLFGIEMDIFVKSPSYDSGGFRSDFTRSSSPSFETNYLLFAMSKRNRQLYLSALLHEVPLCRLDESGACTWIANNFCHGMNISANSKDRAFTALRLIQILKLASYILDQCHKYQTWCPDSSIRNLKNNPMSPILSVLRQPTIHNEWFLLNITIYPALIALNKVTLAGTSNDSNAIWHFYLSSFFLIFIVGAFSNLLGSYISHQGVSGMKGSVAACLGYVLAVNSKKVILSFMEVEMNSGDMMFSIFTMAVFTCFIGDLPVFGRWSFGETVAFSFGGIVGHYVGEYQLNRYGLWWIIPGL